MTSDIDFERVKEIMSRLGDLLEDLGFDSPRREMEAPGPLNHAIYAPKNAAELQLVERYVVELAADIATEVQIAAASGEDVDTMQQARKIVDQCIKALGRCVQ